MCLSISIYLCVCMRCAYHSSNCHQYFYFRLHQFQWQQNKWLNLWAFSFSLALALVSFYCHNSNACIYNEHGIWEKCRFLSVRAYKMPRPFSFVYFYCCWIKLHENTQHFRHVSLTQIDVTFSLASILWAGKNEYVPSCLWVCVNTKKSFKKIKIRNINALCIRVSMPMQYICVSSRVHTFESINYVIVPENVCMGSVPLSLSLRHSCVLAIMIKYLQRCGALAHQVSFSFSVSSLH